MKQKISIITLICLVLGALCGFVLKEKVLRIEFLGSYYLTFLKYLILPVIFTSIAVTSHDSAKNRGTSIIKIVG